MRVVYVLNSNGMYGGATKSFLTMLEGLMAKGISPLVVLPQAGGLQAVLQGKGVETLVLDYRPNTYPYDANLKDYVLWLPRLIARRWLNYRAAEALARRIHGFDIVHTNVSVIDIGARAAERLGLPHVYHFREYGDLDFSFKYYPSKKAFMRSVTHSICITRGIQEHHGLAGDSRSQVIYNPVVGGNAVMPCAEKEDYILFAGRLQETKGIETLLKAYERSTCKYRLLIAGDAKEAEYGQRVRSLAEELGLKGRVEFLGNRQDIAALMQRAQAVVVPSYFEGFGRTTAEAMANGTLVIGHNTGGTKEQFENGLAFTGGPIAIGYNTPEELTAQLSSLESADAEMLCNAFSTVRHFYSNDACIEGVYGLYKKIMRR